MSEFKETPSVGLNILCQLKGVMEGGYDHPVYVKESRLNMFPPAKVSMYPTPKKLFDMGICLCDSCGLMMSVDNKFCVECNDEVMIMVKK